MTVKNSFVSLSEQIIKLQNNSLSVLTSLNLAVSSSDNSVQVSILDENDNPQTVSLPTIGFLKSEIDRLNQNINTLASVDQRGSIIQPAQNIFKKIIVADLNKEPNQLGELGSITNFLSEKNWFFDSLLNPILKVRIDLSGKIEDNVREVLSRRYLIYFELDSSGNPTSRGQTAIDLFNQNFKNRSNVTVTEIETWITNTPGVLQTSLTNFDEQTFSLDPNKLQFEGFFTILERTEDKINKKEYYLIDTLNYTEIETGNIKTLKLNDELILNTPISTTRFRIIEINNDASNIRVRFERIEGQDPIPVSIVGGMKFYSPVIITKLVDISIGFNEYNVLFIKPINTDNFLIARNWSPGMAYFTNDLLLSSDAGSGDNGKTMSTYYLQSVKDYGEILRDLVDRFIPRHLGIIPNTPVLDINNFRVTQLNKHATDTPDLDKNRKQHTLANSLRSNIDEQNKTLVEKRKELFGKNFRTAKDKQNVESQIAKLVQDIQTNSQLLDSTISDILSANTAANTPDSKFGVQGFWHIPSPVQNGKTRPQEVVKFKIQYKYASKSGQENPNDVFKVTDATSGVVINAVFSPWTEVITHIRDRVFDITTQSYVWLAEDLSNIDAPNINSLQLPLTPNEQVEIRVKSISEVGLDNAEIESDWSNTITLTFPDELLNGRKPEDLIVKNAELEAVRSRIINELNGKTLDQHLSDFTLVENKYYAHNTDNLAIKDASGKTISLSDKIKQLEAAENVEAIQGVTLEVPWENFVSGYDTAKFYKHEGRTYLSGLIRVVIDDDTKNDANEKYPNEAVRVFRNPINTTWSRIGVLPVGYRPLGREVFTIVCSSDPTSQRNEDHGRIDILPNGVVLLMYGYSGWISLSGINFRIV